LENYINKKEQQIKKQPSFFFKKLLLSHVSSKLPGQIFKQLQ